MTSFNEAIAQDARLRILQALDGMTDGRLSDAMLLNHLDSWGHRRSIDFIRTQLRKLEEVGGVTIVTREPAFIAEITRAGGDHVARRAVLEGVKRPEPGE